MSVITNIKKNQFIDISINGYNLEIFFGTVKNNAYIQIREKEDSRENITNINNIWLKIIWIDNDELLYVYELCPKEFIRKSEYIKYSIFGLNVEITLFQKG